MSCSLSRWLCIVIRILLVSDSLFGWANSFSKPCVFHQASCTITHTRKWPCQVTATSEDDALTTESHHHSAHCYPDRGLLHDEFTQPKLFVQAKVAQDPMYLRNRSWLVRTCVYGLLTAFAAKRSRRLPPRRTEACSGLPRCPAGQCARLYRRRPGWT